MWQKVEIEKRRSDSGNMCLLFIRHTIEKAWNNCQYHIFKETLSQNIKSTAESGNITPQINLNGNVAVLLLSSLLSDSWELKHATRNISPTNNQANIVDLHPASVYSIRMYSYNAIGKSEASKELTISTEEARKHPGSTALWLMWTWAALWNFFLYLLAYFKP